MTSLGERTIADHHIPGRLAWFEPSTQEYQAWLSERTQFVRDIDPEQEEGKAILSDILDHLETTEIPTSALGGVRISLGFVFSVRRRRKLRLLRSNVVAGILKLTFTPPASPEDEPFSFRFNEVQRLWRTFGGSPLPSDDYILLHATIDTHLKVGKLADKVMAYPELARYVAYKRRQFTESVHKWQADRI